jgi:hypothetical protein
MNETKIGGENLLTTDFIYLPEVLVRRLHEITSRNWSIDGAFSGGKPGHRMGV